MQEIAFPGFKFQKLSGGMPVVCRPHGYPALTYFLTERSLSEKCPLPHPHEKILKKGLYKISNKVVYVYCASRAVGQTNTAPPPPQARLGPYALDASHGTCSQGTTSLCQGWIYFQKHRDIKVDLPQQESDLRWMRSIVRTSNSEQIITLKNS